MENCVEPLKILVFFVNRCVCKRADCGESYPQRVRGAKLSTGGVKNVLFILWKT